MAIASDGVPTRNQTIGAPTGLASMVAAAGQTDDISAGLNTRKEGVATFPIVTGRGLRRHSLRDQRK